MATTYELTMNDYPLGLRQAVWAPRIDGHGFGAMPSWSLASLHANPAHSALRRVRCFEDAGWAISNRMEDRGDYPGTDAEEEAIEDCESARRLALWSVR